MDEASYLFESVMKQELICVFLDDLNLVALMFLSENVFKLSPVKMPLLPSISFSENDEFL